MDEYDSKLKMCALAMIENVNDSSFSVEKLVRYFEEHKSMDEVYNWGLKWIFGRK